jgi:hypothetical protein
MKITPYNLHRRLLLDPSSPPAPQPEATGSSLKPSTLCNQFKPALGLSRRAVAHSSLLLA